MCIIVCGTFTNLPNMDSIHILVCPSGTIGHQCHGMRHFGLFMDSPLCPEGTMGQDRHHKMT